MKYFPALIGVCFFLVWGCQSARQSVVEWSILSRHNFDQLSKDEVNYVRKFEAQSFYVPLFAIDFNQDQKQAVPLKSQELDLKKDSLLRLVPIIEVSNRVFLNTDTAKIAEFTEQVGRRIVQYTDSFPLSELLIDCEWTPDSRQLYFTFLQDLRSYLPYNLDKLSASLPLNYFRFQDTVGLPPVDKVLLKLYNRVELEQINQEADPLNIELIKPFLMDLNSYGLEVEIGIPIGDWGILVRKNKALRVFPVITRREIKRQGEFVPMESSLVKVGENAYFQGEYVSRGDFIRIEPYQNASIKALWPLIKEYSARDTFKICLLNLEPDFDARYPYDLIQRWFSDQE